MGAPRVAAAPAEEKSRSPKTPSLGRRRRTADDWQRSGSISLSSGSLSPGRMPDAWNENLSDMYLHLVALENAVKRERSENTKLRTRLSTYGEIYSSSSSSSVSYNECINDEKQQQLRRSFGGSSRSIGKMRSGSEPPGGRALECGVTRSSSVSLDAADDGRPVAGQRWRRLVTGGTRSSSSSGQQHDSASVAVYGAALSRRQSGPSSQETVVATAVEVARGSRSPESCPEYLEMMDEVIIPGVYADLLPESGDSEGPCGGVCGCGKPVGSSWTLYDSFNGMFNCSNPTV